MKPHPRTEEQDDLLSPRLTEMIDLRHELAKLEKLIDHGYSPPVSGRVPQLAFIRA